MKKLLFSMLAALWVTAALADTYPYLAFQTADGYRNISAQSLEMKFADGQIVASSGSETLSLTVADLSRMFFSTEPAAVTDVTAESQGRVAVYTIDGVCLGNFSSASSAEASLTKGVYIIKGKNATHKIAIK